MSRSPVASPAVCSSVSGAAAPRRAAVAVVVVEPLEGRRLLALTAGFEDVRVLRVDGFEGNQLTTSMEFSPDGRIFVTDSQDGQVEVIKRNPDTGRWTKNATPALTVAVDRYSERGLESVTFDPDFATNRYIYIYYSKADPNNPNVRDNASVNRLVRYRMRSDNPDLADPASATVLIDNIPTPTGVHNGGAMHFGADGMLYLAIGDGGVRSTAQDLSNLNGKVLRLDTAAFNSSGDRSDLIPSDNPFAGQAGKRGEIWAYGLRNPYTGAIKPGTNTLYINDVGQSSWEEINHIVRGGNYGWPLSEGNSSDPDHIDPVHAYTHFPNGTDQPRVQAAITGGVFYDGEQFPASYKGKYFFGDYTRDFIKVFDPATDNVTTFGEQLTGYLDFDVAPDGALWALEVGGNIHRFRWVGTGANQSPTAVATANKTSGPAPLTVNFSAEDSSDPDGDALAYRWTFGDGSPAQTTRDVSHTYDEPGSYTARLVVTDPDGATDETSVRIAVGNDAPVASITSPSAGTMYRGGQTINFSGTGNDEQDGSLPAGAFSWTIVFHHAEHTHPFLGPIDGVKSGSFVAPTTGEFAPDQWYRIHLTVTDSAGLTHTTFRDVTPSRTMVTLASNVPGLSLRLDGSPFEAGGSFSGVEHMVRSIGAPFTQTLDGKTYEFVSWSDGKAATHDISIPLSRITYTANYRLATSTGGGSTTVIRSGNDTHVRNGSFANTSFGSSSLLEIKKGGSGYDRRAFLRFSTHSVTSDIERVVLRLYGNLHSSGGSDLPVDVYGLTQTTWKEGAVTYNNQPTHGSTPIGRVVVRDTTKRWYEIDVTDYVKARRAAGATIVGFALIRPANSDAIVQFHSDEHATNRPQLVVTTTA